MKKLGTRSPQEQLDYHTRRNDTPNFTEGQANRVQLAHFLIDKILDQETHRPLVCVELGCGSGDITGPYTDPGFLRESSIRVIGVDVVPQAVVSVGERFPHMTVILSPVEELEPIECDLLVMTEFLEHVDDPESIVRAWLPKARWSLIGHPLNEPDPPFEPGHIWSYTLQDWYNWFEMGGHHVSEHLLFPMGPWASMVLGYGSR